MEYLGILVAVIILAAVYLAMRGAVDRTSRVQAEALLEQEKARRAQLEEAAAADRARRIAELDAVLAELRTTDDAARVVRERLSRRGPG